MGSSKNAFGFCVGLAVLVVAGDSYAGFGDGTCKLTSSSWTELRTCSGQFFLHASAGGGVNPKVLIVNNFGPPSHAVVVRAQGINLFGQGIEGCVAVDTTEDGSPVVDSTGCETAVKFLLQATWDAPFPF